MPPSAAKSTVRMDEKPAQSSAPKPPDPFPIGSTVDGYKILSILGTGSFATVYLAEELSLGRKVALKVCPTDALEGRTIARLNHEGIVRVHSQSKIQGFAVINMQFVPSVTLEAVIQALSEREDRTLSSSRWIEWLDSRFQEEMQLTVSEFRVRERLTRSSFSQKIAWIGLQMAESLAHAHERGILHLDIKPSNILIHRSGKPYLMDFNVSVQNESLKAGVPENFGGTFDFMAPEQTLVFFSADRASAIKKVGEHSDVFSLGMVLKKFHDLSPSGTEEFLDLQSILAKATEKKIENRYRDARELVGALEGFLESAEIRSRLPRQDKLVRWVARHPVLGITLMGALPQLFATLIGYLYNYSQIINRLGVAQQDVFQKMNLYYNPIVSTIAGTIWFFVMKKLYLDLKSPAGRHAEIRRFLLRVPHWGSIVASISWLPGAVLFPLVIHFGSTGLTVATASHFVTSFLLSYFIAVSYSFVIHGYFVTTAVYPRLWSGETGIRRTAFLELRPLVRRMKGFCTMTVAVPLVSVLIFLYRSGDFQNAEHYASFRLLMALLTSPGTAGIWFAVSATERVRALFRQFTASS